MFTPYDWQEAIGNRAQYIEGRLAQGAPVLAVSIPEGVLVFTFRRQGRKIFEIYDRLVFSGIGQQSDVEGVRSAALEFASKEGFTRSEEDVTIQRVATGISASVKRAFGEFSGAPFVARCLFAEVNRTPDEDLFYVLDYDGDYAMSRRYAVVAGSQAVADAASERLKAFVPLGGLQENVDALRDVWLSVMNPNGEKSTAELTEGWTIEAAILERSDARENRFRLLTPEEF